MKIVVTGATGFLGRYLVGELFTHNHELIILKREHSSSSSIRAKYGSIPEYGIDRESIKRLFEEHGNVDAVIHAATDYGRDSDVPLATFWANEVFPLTLLECALDNGVKKFINIDTFFNSAQSSYSYMQSYTLSKKHFQEWGRYCGESALISFINASAPSLLFCQLL